MPQTSQSMTSPVRRGLFASTKSSREVRAETKTLAFDVGKHRCEIGVCHSEPLLLSIIIASTI